MRIIVLLELALFVAAAMLLAKPALAGDPTKSQLNSDTLSTSIPRYMRQGNRSYLALVRCEQAEIRLKGTRSEGTQLALSILNTNLPGTLPKPSVINSDFWSSGPAIMNKGQYYLIILTGNQNQTLEAYPFGFIDFSINNQSYRLTDYFVVAEKEGQTMYDKTLLALNRALENIE